MNNSVSFLRCCNEDGLILKPSKPATSIDRQLIMVMKTISIRTGYSKIQVYSVVLMQWSLTSSLF